MYSLVMVLHLIVCFILILSILVFQTSKGSALNMFGGGGETLFAAPTATDFIKKFTGWMAIAFAVTSLLLTILAPQARYRSVIQDNPLPQQTQEQSKTQNTKG
jgi:preprotein translocase subunit SecG